MNLYSKNLSRHVFGWIAVLCVAAILLASCSQTSTDNASNSAAVGQDSQAPQNSGNSASVQQDEPPNEAEPGESDPANTDLNNSAAESPANDPATNPSLVSEELLSQPDDNQQQELATRLSYELLTLEEIASIWLPHMEWALSVEILGETVTTIANTMDAIDEARRELNEQRGSASEQADSAPEQTGPTSIRFNQDATFISASAAKPFWMVAVAAELGIEAIAEFAPDVLCQSDNVQTAEVIKLIGIDRINEFLHNRAGMTDTFLLAWSFGEEPPEPASEEWTSQTNYTSNRTTVTDAVSFYSQLYYGELLNPQDTEVMLGWLEEFSRCKAELAQPLLLRLPQEIQVWHKAGWLPPMCCISETATLNDFGIVSAGETSYSIAIATQGGEVSEQTYLQQQNFVSYASCRILAAVLGEPTPCQRSQDAGLLAVPEA